MFLYPREDVDKIEYRAGRCANGVGKGLEGERAEVEREPFEGRVDVAVFGFSGARANARGICVFGSPFGMCYLDHSRVSRGSPWSGRVERWLGRT